MPDIKHFDFDATLDTLVELFWRNGLAATGVQDIVAATGLNRSSLYATFGSKQTMYLYALRRYVDTWSTPIFRQLADDGRGVPAISELFDRLIQLRCRGPFAGWGCMVTNAHAGIESCDSEIRSTLERHHAQLRDAILAALGSARAQDQLPDQFDINGGAELLASLVYSINLRSRCGSEATHLRRAVANALDSIGYPKAR